MAQVALLQALALVPTEPDKEELNQWLPEPKQFSGDLFSHSVFRNGDLLCPPFRFIIPRSMRQELGQILSLITEKVSLRTGAVRRSVALTAVTHAQADSAGSTGKKQTSTSRPWVRLCSVEGVTVSSAAELESGRYYVAVGTERFKKLPYVELLLSKATERYCHAKVLKVLMRGRESRADGAFVPPLPPPTSLRQQPGKRKLTRRNEVKNVSLPTRNFFFSKRGHL